LKIDKNEQKKKKVEFGVVVYALLAQGTSLIKWVGVLDDIFMVLAPFRVYGQKNSDQHPFTFLVGFPTPKA